MSCSGDRRLLASTSHDTTMRLWDLSMLHDDEEEPEQAEAAPEV